MKSLLILNRIRVENANAIAGIVYGFPAVTHFLGYVHALSRDLKASLDLELGGCGIICHDFQIKAYETGGWKDSFFSLTKNPLLKDGSTPAFNEEGKVHIEISLVIECNFTDNDFNFNEDNPEEDSKEFEKLVFQLAAKRRVAGGIVTNISSVSFLKIPSDDEAKHPFLKKEIRKLLPGFLLRERSDLLKKHLTENVDMNPLDALLDFYVIKSKAKQSEETENDKKIQWEYIPKPERGWFVPLQIGYKAISPLYKEGEVACARDRNVPFRFVEPVYGLGEWIGLHRITDLETIFWHYHHKNDMYLCSNNNKHLIKGE